MTRVTGSFRTSVATRVVAVAGVMVLSVAAAACGDTTKTTPNTNAPATTQPAKAAASGTTAPAATTAPTTTAAPKSGGAGF